MPEEIEWKERSGKRDLSYSIWHRKTCGRHLYCIDIDAVEYCPRCNEPLALIELAVDIGQEHKSTVVMANLAKKAGVPAYLVFYAKDASDSIQSFRVSQEYPRMTDERQMTPFEYQMFLCSLRYRHKCYKTAPDLMEDMLRSLAHFALALDTECGDDFVQAALLFLETWCPF